MSYYDLGEIRTESAARPSPPEKKNGWESEEPKTPRNLQGADYKYICSLNSLQFLQVLAKEFFKLRICASKLNIYFGYLFCQVEIGTSHNLNKTLFFNSEPVYSET